MLTDIYHDVIAKFFDDDKDGLNKRMCDSSQDNIIGGVILTPGFEFGLFLPRQRNVDERGKAWQEAHQARQFLYRIFLQTCDIKDFILLNILINILVINVNFHQHDYLPAEAETVIGLAASTS